MHLSCPYYVRTPSPPAHSSWLDHPNNIWWWVQLVKLLIMAPPVPCCLVRRRPKCLQYHVLEHLAYVPLSV
jgi:hypothetical protein